MGAGHNHAQPPGGDRGASRKRLAWTLGLVAIYMVAEVVGGLVSGSLALLSDAGHMLSDAGSLALALFALRMAERPRSAEKTFGYHRTEILAALANGATLVAIAVFIIVEAWERVREPGTIDGGLMMGVAVGGLVVNLAALRILHGGRDASLNLRGAWLHVVADALGSVQAIAAGVVILGLRLDLGGPAGGGPDRAPRRLVRLVAAPRSGQRPPRRHPPAHRHPREVAEAIVGVPGVSGVHDLHVWTITSGFDSLSAHVRVEEETRDRQAVLADVRELVRDRFQIGHSTIQLEGDEPCADGCCD